MHLAGAGTLLLLIALLPTLIFPSAPSRLVAAYFIVARMAGSA
jgi:hypothetical protein